MGILNRTPDSFYDHGSYWDFEAFLRVADRLVTEGADVLDVGGVKQDRAPRSASRRSWASGTRGRSLGGPLRPAGLGRPWRASVAEAAFAAGAVVDDISGFADSRYLEVCAGAGAAVVATHIRLAPRVPDPSRVRRRGRGGERVPRRSSGMGRGCWHPAPTNHARRRPRSRQDRGAVARAAALLGPPGRARLRRPARPPTSGSSATCAAPRWTIDGTPPWRHALGIGLGCRVLHADVRAARWPT